MATIILSPSVAGCHAGQGCDAKPYGCRKLSVLGGEGGGSLPMYSVVIPMSDVVAETQVFTALAF